MLWSLSPLKFRSQKPKNNLKNFSTASNFAHLELIIHTVSFYSLWRNSDTRHM